MHLELAKSASIWASLLPSLIGAFLGLFSALTVAHLNARFTAFSNSYSKVIEKVEKVAELSSEYWLLSFHSLPPKSTEKELQATSKGQLLEARILGLQEQILLLDSQLRAKLPKATRRSIDSALLHFLDSISGGDFMERKGSADVKMSRQCQQASAKLIAAIHKALRKKNPFWPS